MNKIKIFCTSLNYYKIIDKLPSYIQPLGLGVNNFPKNWIDEKKGKNISELNKNYGEFTGFYWVWKNVISSFSNSDLIGFCHYRKLWMNQNLSKKNKFSIKSIYSNLLLENNPILKNSDCIQVRPIIFKKKNLFEDFQEVHKCDILEQSINFLNNKDQINFSNYLKGNIFFPLNMFITKKSFFEEYCEIIFPWLEKCLDYCKKRDLLKDYNVRLPAFLGERFTSYWFSKFENKTNLNYARLGNFFLNNKLNNHFNTLKIPFTSRMYPTIHKY